MTISLAELASAAATRDPTGIAVACGKRRLTYAELDRAAASVAEELLDRGLQRGNAVAVMAGIGLEFPVLAYGILRAGGVLVPISHLSPAAEVTQLLRASKVELVMGDVEREATALAAAQAFDANCGAVVVDLEARRSVADRLALTELLQGPGPAPPERVGSDEPAVILFTSGSTDHPKGVLHSHEGLYRNALCVAWEMTALTPRDVLLGALPLAHSFGLSAVLNAALLAGTRLELMPRFDADAAWKLIHDRGVTVVTGVPAMFRRLAESRAATRNSDLRLAVVSGSACPRDLARDVRLRMGVHVVERYGMTEASPLTWRVVTDDAGEGDVGWAGWGVHIRVVAESGKVQPAGQTGELQVQAPGMMLRYLRPADTREAFDGAWLRTGDLGYVRPDGGVTLVSRIKEVILRGGYTVSASEVERVLSQHPAVADAAVVGVPDDDLGEEVAAVLVPQKGRTIDVDDLERHVGELLATWKRPRAWRTADRIPRTQLGKVKRQELVKLFSENGTS